MMIGFVRGSLIQRDLGEMLVMTSGGVGYEIHVPTTAFAQTSPGGEVAAWVHTRVREDQLQLYGFETWQDRRLFAIMLQISGVGPRLALSVLSHFGVSQLLAMTEHAEPLLLCQVPGIGSRSAEKIVLELRAKRSRLEGLLAENHRSFAAAPEGTEAAASGPAPALFRQETVGLDAGGAARHELRTALRELGYKEKEINVIWDTEGVLTPPTLAGRVRAALRVLSLGKLTPMSGLDALQQTF